MIEEYFDLFIHWITRHSHWTGIVVFIIAMVESLAIVGLVIPGVAMMFAVGALIGSGLLPFVPICLWAITGAVAGDGLSFWLGRHFHMELKKLWPFRSHPWLIDRGVRFFHRYGSQSILLGRFVGPVRAVIPLVAGMLDMPPGRFLVINIVSAILWAPAYLLPGMVFGASLDLASKMAGRLVAIIILLIVLAWLTIWLSKKLYRLLQLRTYRFNLGWIVIIFAFCFMIVQYSSHYQNDLPPVTSQQAMSQVLWRNSGWKSLPPIEKDPLYHQSQELNIQWSAPLEEILEIFYAQGWEKPSTLNFQNTLHWLNPDADIAKTPFLPKLIQGKPESLILIKKETDSTALVLRLWPSKWVIEETGVNLWIGQISLFQHEQRSVFLNLPEQVPADEPNLDKFLSALMTVTSPVSYTLVKVAQIPPIVLVIKKQKDGGLRRAYNQVMN